MKKTPLLRMLALFLAVSLLSGCGGAAQQGAMSVVDGQTGKPKEEPSVQKEMPQEELDQALADIDLAVLCATFGDIQRVEKLENPYIVAQDQVICTDYDGDGYKDILLGRTSHLTFKLSPQRSVDYVFAQSSPDYYTDDAGNLYQCNGLGDGFDIEVDGKPGWVDHMNYWYKQWKNDQWETVYSYKGTRTYVEATDSDGQSELELVEDAVVAQMQGQECTKAQLDAHFEDIGMRWLYTRPADYTRNTYDIVYKDSLLAGLDTYFSENYSGYTQKLSQDIDGDGKEETVFLLPDFEDTWRNALVVGDEYSSIQDAQGWFEYTFPGEYNYTGVVIADETDSTVTVSAYCALQYLSAYEGMDIRAEGGYLWLDGTKVYATGDFDNLSGSTVPEKLVSYLAEFGYGESFFRQVDISDMEGDEYLCICRKDGSWYMFVIIIMNGDPVVIYSGDVNDSAVYLTEYQGKQAVLAYYQGMYTAGGETTTYYNYSIERIDASGEVKILEYAYANYTDKDQDATVVSKFFNKLNGYLLKIIVVRDPFKLTGKMWMNAAEIVHGTVPQEEQTDSEQPDQNTDQETVMGFVQIEDPSSWLHLRVGPGMEYDKVLTDPSDPDSFVRQALGSPVTVLETIETDDAENPVWLKIRITYADREIVGYSSKTYIRLAGE